jgi:cytochrome c oxidase cbb3-type subunit III
MTDNKIVDLATGTETVGHEWDGIQELNTPLPRWWLWAFYATIVFAIGYTIAYPAWPMLHGATRGMLGWSSHGQLDAATKADQQRKAAIRLAIAQTPVEQLPDNPRMMQAAIEGGRSVFKVTCAQCHGSGATGSKGFPNLNDDDWLWGGDLVAIHKTISDGVRQPNHDATRTSQMPAFGRDGILQPQQISDVAAYVRLVSGQTGSSPAARRGAAVFVQNCVACHGPDAKGNRTVGAPNLTDFIWLYGGDRATIVETLTNGRQGVMPRWNDRFDPVTIKMLAAYVYSLGGGEKPQVKLAAQTGKTSDGQP